MRLTRLVDPQGDTVTEVERKEHEMVAPTVVLPADAHYEPNGDFVFYERHFQLDIDTYEADTLVYHEKCEPIKRVTTRAEHWAWLLGEDDDGEV
jgi:hypothetical protein